MVIFYLWFIAFSLFDIQYISDVEQVCHSFEQTLETGYQQLRQCIIGNSTALVLIERQFLVP